MVKSWKSAGSYGSLQKTSNRLDDPWSASMFSKIGISIYICYNNYNNNNYYYYWTSMKYIYISVYICISIYIYIYREREFMYMYKYIYICICISIYKYIYMLCLPSMGFQATHSAERCTPHAADEMLRTVLRLQRLLGSIVCGHACRFGDPWRSAVGPFDSWGINPGIRCTFL